MTTLHSFPKVHRRKPKRVGRGHGSGRGTYAGRGIKGQRARSGGQGGHQRRALTRLAMRLPKMRGFVSQHKKLAVVNVATLDAAFASGDKVTLRALITKRLVPRASVGYKVLGEGALTKTLTVEARAFSGTAAKAITGAGGTVVRLKS